ASLLSFVLVRAAETLHASDEYVGLLLAGSTWPALAALLLGRWLNPPPPWRRGAEAPRLAVGLADAAGRDPDGSPPAGGGHPRRGGRGQRRLAVRLRRPGHRGQDPPPGPPGPPPSGPGAPPAGAGSPPRGGRPARRSRPTRSSRSSSGGSAPPRSRSWSWPRRAG